MYRSVSCHSMSLSGRILSIPTKKLPLCVLRDSSEADGEYYIDLSVPRLRGYPEAPDFR
jgi:hypothetical protein